MTTLTLHPPRPSLAVIGHAIIETFRRAPIRDLTLAAAIVVAASVVVHADERFPDWIPDALSFPDDAEVVTDRSVGSSIRLFSISTQADVDALLADWENELNENGYPVTQEAGELLDQSIEFTGPGIANAKIIVAPTTDGARSLIEFDATLN